MPKPAPISYRTANWSDYKAALWLAASLVRFREGRRTRQTGKRGRPETFSDAAVRAFLTLKLLFGLPLRQTDGLLDRLTHHCDIVETGSRPTRDGLEDTRLISLFETAALGQRPCLHQPALHGHRPELRIEAGVHHPALHATSRQRSLEEVARLFMFEIGSKLR